MGSLKKEAEAVWEDHDLLEEDHAEGLHIATVTAILDKLYRALKRRAQYSIEVAKLGALDLELTKHYLAANRAFEIVQKEWVNYECGADAGATPQDLAAIGKELSESLEKYWEERRQFSAILKQSRGIFNHITKPL